jgi:hypothetical protein
MKLSQFAAAAGLAIAMSGAQAGPTVLGTYDASLLASTIAGSGVTISNTQLTTAGSPTLPAAAGTFTGGASTVGLSSGIVLTTGTVACAGAGNTSESCELRRSTIGDNGAFDRTTLSFDFTSQTGQVFFRYVFASEEYTQFAPSQFNDEFELLLNGTNIALLPGSGGVVSINNVNCGSNTSFYRNNLRPGSGEANQAGCGPTLALDLEYDGLTTVLTASGSVVAGAQNSFAFTIFDRADNRLDSGVYIEAGSFSGTDPGNPIPEPGTLALVAASLIGLRLARRR